MVNNSIEFLNQVSSQNYGGGEACFTFTFDQPRDSFVLGGAFNDRDNITYVAADGEVLGTTHAPHPFSVDFPKDISQMIKCKDAPVVATTVPATVDTTPTPATTVPATVDTTPTPTPTTVKPFLPATGPGEASTPIMGAGLGAIVAGGALLYALKHLRSSN